MPPILTTPPQVYSADWLLTGPEDCDCHLYREGYAGTWVRSWNGWAVFTVAPAVMPAIVATQQRVILDELDRQRARGLQPDDALLKAQQALPWMYWLSDRVVIDSRELNQDPACIEVITPDPDGRYQVGFGWTWDQVDPADVHTIHSGTPQPVPETTPPNRRHHDDHQPTEESG